MTEILIEFKEVSLGYGQKEILSNLNFEIYQNDFIGIVGPNGAGKTTLLRAILGILKPLKGEIIYKHSRSSPSEKKDVTNCKFYSFITGMFKHSSSQGQVKLKFGYVPQIQTIDEIFPLTVYEIILMGRYSQMGLIGKPQKIDRDKVFSVLKYLEIEQLANKTYTELSGGLRQRVLLARALVCDPDILVLDEPTNDLDLSSEKITMDLIKKLHIEKNITVLMVSHLLNNVINYVEKIAFINPTPSENEITSVIPLNDMEKCRVNSKEFKIFDIKDVLTEENLSEVYGIKIRIGNLEDKKIVIAR